MKLLTDDVRRRTLSNGISSHVLWPGELKRSENLSKAIDAVRSKQMSIRKAAEIYGVKKSTLGDHLTGKVSRKSSGRSTVFSSEVGVQS